MTRCRSIEVGEPFVQVNGGNNQLAPVSQNIQGDGRQGKTGRLHQLGIEPFCTAWEGYVAVPMAKHDLFGHEENSTIDSTPESTFLVQPLCLRIGEKPTAVP